MSIGSPVDADAAREALVKMRERAARLRLTRPDYPDTPEQIEERDRLVEALYWPQMEAIAGREEAPA